MPFDAKCITVVPEPRPSGPVRVPVPQEVYKEVDVLLAMPWRKSEFWNEDDDVMRTIGRSYAVTCLTNAQRGQVTEDYTKAGWLCRLHRNATWASIQFIPREAHEAAKRGNL